MIDTANENEREQKTLECLHPEHAIEWCYPYSNYDLGICRVEYDCGLCGERYLGRVEVLSEQEIAEGREWSRRCDELRSALPAASAAEILNLALRSYDEKAVRS